MKLLGGRPGIRQLIDEVQQPPLLVLRHLDDNLLNVCHAKGLGRPELKLVAKQVLLALQTFHERGCVHTGTYTPSSSPHTDGE